MRLSDDKIDQLAAVVLDRLLALEDEDDSIMVMGEDGEIRANIRHALIDFLRRDEQVHERVRRKIASMKRTIPDGSAEWEALYSQFLREEMDKIRKVR